MSGFYSECQLPNTDVEGSSSFSGAEDLPLAGSGVKPASAIRRTEEQQLGHSSAVAAAPRIKDERKRLGKLNQEVLSPALRHVADM